MMKYEGRSLHVHGLPLPALVPHNMIKIVLRIISIARILLIITISVVHYKPSHSYSVIHTRTRMRHFILVLLSKKDIHRCLVKKKAHNRKKSNHPPHLHKTQIFSNKKQLNPNRKKIDLSNLPQPTEFSCMRHRTNQEACNIRKTQNNKNLQQSIAALLQVERQVLTLIISSTTAYPSSVTFISSYSHFLFDV